MMQELDLSWKKGVSLTLLIALTLSLIWTAPYASAEETVSSAETTESPSESKDETVTEEASGDNPQETALEEENQPDDEPVDDSSSQESNESANEENEEASMVALSTAEIEAGAASTEENRTNTNDFETNSSPEEGSQESSNSPEDEVESAGGTGNSSGGSSPDADNEEEVMQITNSSGTDEVMQTTLATSTETTPITVANTVINSITTALAATTTTIGTATSSATSTPVTIQSGEAIALANIINIVNSNFINSDGVVFFSNFFDAITEALDLRKLYDSLSNFGCSLTDCDNDSTTVNLSNNASIENFLLLQAMTGGNLISGAQNGVINTGNAYAGLNLVNVANMNFIDSNYLLVTLNAFNDVNNDIIFPSTDLLLSSLAYSPRSAQINVNNNATVNNNVNIDADSGGNVLETANGGSITTGATGATSNVFNQINTSLIGGQNITILFRIHGDWVGEVFGAPDDLLWYQSPDGSIILFDSNSGTSGSQNAGALNLNAANYASINNHVNVVALTGENQITGTETGLISTGNAYAGANIVNLANGNVVGRNWVLAIVNIFGDFKGNIAFGRPDLWVGEMVDAPSKVKNGSVLKYKFTVINNGDSPATQVTLEDQYASEFLTIKNASMPFTVTTDGKLRFNIGKIPRGGAVEISYEAEVTGTTPGQELTNVVRVKGRETDNNIQDNTDTATVETSGRGGSNSKPKKREMAREVREVPLLMGVAETGMDILRVKRVFKNFPLTVAYPSMRQVVVLYNPTQSTIPAVKFEDILHDPDGNPVQTEVWDLGDVLPGEEIELGYTLTFKSTAAPGAYKLYSKITTGTGARDTHENGTVWFTTGLLPEELPSFLNEIELLAPRLTSVPIYFASSLTDMNAKTYENLFYQFDEGGILLPALSSHSMSTATRQQNTFGELSGWLNKLYLYLSSLVAKVVPAIAYAWGNTQD